MSDSLIDKTNGLRLGGVDETETAFTVPLGEGLYSYARRESPTVSDGERALAEIETSKTCILTPCGMAASGGNADLKYAGNHDIEGPELAEEQT